VGGVGVVVFDRLELFVDDKTDADEEVEEAFELMDEVFCCRL
jgi:hypothetical protein